MATATCRPRSFSCRSPTAPRGAIRSRSERRRSFHSVGDAHPGIRWLEVRAGLPLFCADGVEGEVVGSIGEAEAAGVDPFEGEAQAFGQGSAAAIFHARAQ